MRNLSVALAIAALAGFAATATDVDEAKRRAWDEPPPWSRGNTSRRTEKDLRKIEKAEEKRRRKAAKRIIEQQKGAAS